MKIFNQVGYRKPKKNLFDLSHERKLSLNMGELIPILCQEVVPGDQFKINTETLLRLAPLIAPVMARIDVHVHHWFVPNRLVWDNFETFITGGEDGKQKPAFPHVLLNPSAQGYFEKGSLADYFGLPLIANGNTNFPKINALPFRAYLEIYNEYYRDQNLIPKVIYNKTDGMVSDLAVILSKRIRAYEKDYFTSSLPNTQRGDEVLLPAEAVYSAESTFRSANTGEPPITGLALNAEANTGRIGAVNGTEFGSVENISGLSTTINDLRTAVRLQEWLEKSARAGSRYAEQLLAFFGVKSDDYRLQRPLYLGGGKMPVNISEVLSTFNSAEVPGANMYGHGITVGSTNSFKQSFKEHGYILGIMSILPRTSYASQGINRMWLKEFKEDFYFPEFAHLGEQPVYNEELYFTGTEVLKQTFAYQSRYAEYKYCPGSSHADMRDNLDFWHLDRIFSAPPVLNQSFIEAVPDTRIFAVEDPLTHKIYVHLYNDVKAVRPMPFFGTPML